MAETVTIDIQHFELYEPTGRNYIVCSFRRNDGTVIFDGFLMVYRSPVTTMLLLSFEVW